MGSKTKALKGHAKKRAFCRYKGKTLDNRSIRAIVHKIQSGTGEHICKRSTRVSEWKIEHDGVIWHVLYDKDRHTLITCLTPRKGRATTR